MRSCSLRRLLKKKKDEIKATWGPLWKKGDYVFRMWLRREGFLTRVFEKAYQIVSNLMDVPVSLGAKTKDVEKQTLKKVDTLRMAAQCLAFRFFMFLVFENMRGETCRCTQLSQGKGNICGYNCRRRCGHNACGGLHCHCYRLQSGSLESDMDPDSDWLLIMMSTTGEAIGWLERFCYVAEMVVHRRIVVLHHGAYGYFKSFWGPTECLCSVLFMVHRVEEMAQTMAVDMRYNSEIYEMHRSHNVYIDDECEN
ncbi:hypothetical protein GOP47_0010703 [Adiantum capillus-veneris]|uniref:Uncharacterized protein n=1 Tax=Adiantum capillus-veneris TaxID=13818 RepID=A0A9D4UWJ4_ADICA|nr:hypothetical protein GOP47_0010703 [Adiantum capillus-veneris]